MTHIIILGTSAPHQYTVRVPDLLSTRDARVIYSASSRLGIQKMEASSQLVLSLPSTPTRNFQIISQWAVIRKSLLQHTQTRDITRAHFQDSALYSKDSKDHSCCSRKDADVILPSFNLLPSLFQTTFLLPSILLQTFLPCTHL